MTDLKQLSKDEYEKYLRDDPYLKLKEEEIKLILDNIFRKNRPLPVLETNKKNKRY